MIDQQRGRGGFSGALSAQQRSLGIVLVVERQARCVLDALLVQDQFDLRDQAGEI